MGWVGLGHTKWTRGQLRHSADKRHEVTRGCLAEYFDVFLIHRRKDEEKMAKLREILQKFVARPGDRQLTFSLEDIHVPFINTKFHYFEKSLQRSRYKFVYIGDDFTSGVSDADDDDDDEFEWQLSQHYALNRMIRNRDNSVVPVTDGPRTTLPTILDILRRLDVWKLLRQRSLDDISDVGDLGDADIHGPTRDFVRRMFDPRALPTPS